MDNKYNSLPEEPEKRRTILVISESGLETLKRSSWGDLSVRDTLDNEQVSLLNVDALTTHNIQNSSVVKKLKGSGLLNPGSMLIQSPYDSSIYANADVASYKFAQEKCVLFAELCAYLAAKKVSAKHMELKITDSEKKINLSIDSPYAEVGGQAAKSAWEQMKKQVNINETFPQQNPNIDSARELIEQYQFLSDSYINSLFRRRKSGVLIETSTYTLSVTEESKQNLDLAFSLNIPTQVGLKIDVKTLKKETFEFSVEYEVEFW